MTDLVKSTYSSKTFKSDKFKLTKEWVDQSASYIYRLYNRYKTFTDGFASPSYSWHKVAEGDEDWATKTAEHYGIEIENS